MTRNFPCQGGYTCKDWDRDKLSCPKPKRKYKHKTVRQKLVERCDAAIRAYVLFKEKWCFVCGATSDLQCGHLFTRSKASTRWEELNCHAQCRGCNMYHEHNPHRYVVAFIKKYGLEVYNWLYETAEKPRKFTLDKLEEIAEYWEERLTLAKASSEER